MPAKKIGTLPPLVVRQLCRYLNTEGAGVRNWKDLIAYAPGNVYDAIYDVAAFARAGGRIDSSPAEEVLTDFASLGFSCDDLYTTLARMDARQAMETLEEHVSPEVLANVREERRQHSTPPSNSGRPPPMPDHAPSSPDTHPEYGPLPPHPPPTTAQTLAASHDTGLYGDPYPPSQRSHDQSQRSHDQSRRSHDQSTPSWSNGYVSSSGWSSDTALPPLTTDFSRPSSSSQQTTPPPSDHMMPPSGHVTPNILHFSYAELSDVTGDFTAHILGMGAFGTVFKTKIRGNGPYAVKRLHNESEIVGGGMFYDTSFHRDTFAQELQVLTRYNHRNILSLVAYSNDGPVPCLVYEYMKHGSLAECLVAKREIVLPWYLRLDIAKQIADALHFLHTVNKPTCLVHGDVKSANILLDANLVPKLSDFGLARELKRAPNERSTYSTKSDVVMGTMAYMAPEFIRNKKFTARTDVYSYGVVLLEMYSGQPALSSDPAHHNRVLTDRLSRLIADSEGHRDEVVAVGDPRAKWPAQNAVELFDIATVCLVHIPRKRPGMDQVLIQLEAILPPMGAI